MTAIAQEAFNALLRKDFLSFLHKVICTVHPAIQYKPGRHIEAIAYFLESLRHGKERRGIINLPPRTLKSTIILAWVCWQMGHNPRLRIIVASYGEMLAKKFHNDFRTIVKAEWHQRVFPAMAKAPLKDTDMEYETAEHGFRLAVTIGGAMTGRGADIIIIDDPIKAQDARSETIRNDTNTWILDTLSSRLDNPAQGIILLVMQRLHEDDPSGFLLGRGGYRHLCIPALAPKGEAPFPLTGGKIYQRVENEPIQPDYCGEAKWQQIKEDIGSIVFSAQYQQNPIPAGGNLFKRCYFESVYNAESIEALKPFNQLVASWDVASKTGERHDYSVCTVWGVKENTYYLLHVLRKKLEYPALRDCIKSLVCEMGIHTCLIEDQGVGEGLIQELKCTLSGCEIVPIKPQADKVTRAEIQLGIFESGTVHMPEDAPWLEEYIKEFLSFPNGKHDDQVDSTTQFLSWARKNPYYPVFCFDSSRDEDYDPCDSLSFSNPAAW